VFWPFGPQVLFEPEISSLADLKGLKVRVYDQRIANFVSLVGGTPFHFPLGKCSNHWRVA
jgi:TRAP-type C4-dicarboxylate transport system substrate-binding protein